MVTEGAVIYLIYCETGWFGSSCQYRCRCMQNNCDANGLCTGSDRCLNGWFGPACQYADLAYNRSDFTEITDADDDTCNTDPHLDRVHVQLKGIFTWLRVVVSNPKSRYQLKFRLRFGSSVDWCTDGRTAPVSERVLDVYCPSNRTVLGVIILGLGVRHLCSLYISGGRNMALRQFTNQSTTSTFAGPNNEIISLGPDKAVDGFTDGNTKMLTCTHTINDDKLFGQYWTVRLGHPGRVSRYVLYNRLTMGYRLIGFKLESFSKEGAAIFSFADASPISQTVYTIHNETLGVASVTISLPFNKTRLTLCEVEVYGDTICESGHYGRECEKQCNCLNSEDCFVSSGGCPSGCHTGYHGENCRTPCSSDQYGQQCTYNCSQFCVRDLSDDRTCDLVSGRCFRGCQSGYSAPRCETVYGTDVSAVCDADKGEAECGSFCSPACARPVHDTVEDPELCSIEDGVCLYGCDAGYSGPSCLDVCRLDTYGRDCVLSCNKNCRHPEDEFKSSCDHVNGSCLHGCISGPNRTYCEM
ncbi:unnamed protein product, partial [Candidula unifasciata]